MFGSGLGLKIAKNTFYQLIGKVVSMSITVFIVLIITRSYGREGYGSFSLMQTWPALFFVIVDFGINAIATRELSKDWSKVSDYLGSILLIRIAFSFIIIVGLALSLIFLPYSVWLREGIILSLFLILTQALFASTNIIFQVKLRYDLSVIGYLLGYLVILILALYLSFIKADVRLVSFTYVIGGIVTFLINMVFIKRMGIKINFKYNKKIIGYLLWSSLPLGLMFVFSQINFKADSILLSVLKLPMKYGLNNIESVGVYSLPYKVFEVALVVPTFLMNSVFPVMVHKMNKSIDDMKELFFKSLKSLILVALLGSLVGIIFAPWIIDILGGAEFIQSVLVLRILFTGLIFYYLTQPFAWLLVTLDSQKYLPYIYLISAIFNVLTNWYFIPRYSFFASSIITAVSEFLILLMLIFTVQKVLRTRYAKN
jgi:O-antigen/teichoic acid export membrane protein